MDLKQTPTEIKLAIAMKCLEELRSRGTGHEEHPTCMSSVGPFGSVQFGPPRTGGWEGWAREIQATLKQKVSDALNEIQAVDSTDEAFKIQKP